MPNRFYDIERPIKKDKLPEVISKQEVQAMIQRTKNLKHKCIIALLYSTGMRRGELLNLKLTDIDSKRMSVFIRNGKGGKDRYTLLGQQMLKDLRGYYQKFEPEIWLFEGKKGEKYSGTSVENVVKDAARRANIKKRVTPHTLRHCFGTHSLETGIDLRYVQTIMGHQTSKTTEIYTHVSSSTLSGIKNLLD